MMRLWLLLITAWCACCAHAADDLLEGLPRVPRSATRLEQIETDLRAGFDAALRQYDDYLKANSHDVIGQLQRCTFIEEFAATYEYASFSEQLNEQAEQCRAETGTRFPQHPEITLRDIERSYGKQRLQAAQQALRDTPRQSWTEGQMARLYTLLAITADDLGNNASSEYARAALSMDERSDVRLLLARKLAAKGQRSDAVDVLTSGIDGHDPADSWYLLEKMQLLADAAARPQVMTVYALLRERRLDYDALSAARVLRRVQAVSEARWELERVASSGGAQASVGQERFRFEMDFGTGTAALAAYNQWRAAGWRVDPLGINRMALLARQPWLPWQWHDVIGVAVLLGLLAASGVLMIIPIALVHYRGLARRAHGCEPYPRGDWRLRDAWFALFALSIGSVFALYCAGPLQLQLNLNNWGVDATSTQLARIALVEAFLTAVLLLPLARLAGQHEMRWWGTQWGVVRCVATGVAVGLALRLPLLLALSASKGRLPSQSVQQPLWEMLQSLSDQYGMLSALWLVAVFAPVIEEFVFRGVLLRAFTRHLSFFWANVLQGLLFAAMHMDLRAAPYLFAVGVAAGALARRSGGLLAPIALHSTFNLVAGMLLIGKT